MDPFLDAIAANDAVFMTDTLGEPVEYRPYQGEPRTIMAVIDRKPVMVTPTRSTRPQIRIMCSTDPVKGIDPITLDIDHDRVYVQYIPGQANGEKDLPYRFGPNDLNVQTTGILDAILT
ncbi:MAG: hypothetical protein QM754_18535 [Tepidisphaeraceae bacterium]